MTTLAALPGMRDLPVSVGEIQALGSLTQNTNPKRYRLADRHLGHVALARHPETELDLDDPGDDTFLRYRYQATYAAILSLRMMRPSAEIVEVFVEHHDDILLKMKSKRFNAVQVKTQQLGGPPFKSGDEPIRTALGKFISHDRKFGDLFERYTLATNHHFFRKENTSSLFHLIKLADKATGHAPSDMDRGLSGFINSLLTNVNKGKRGAERATREHALNMLKKLHLDDSLPKLEEDIHQKLRTAIAQANKEYRAATYAVLEQAADALSHLTYMRSSKPVDGAAHLRRPWAYTPKRSEPRATNGRITEYRHPVNDYRMFKRNEIERLIKKIREPIQVRKTK